MLIQFHTVDQNYTSIKGERHILWELKEAFSFFANGYKWDKRFTSGYWDGKISAINMKDKVFRSGLLEEIKKYCTENDIDFEDNTESEKNSIITDEHVLAFYEHIKGPYVPHDSQISAFIECVNRRRNLIEAPTSNGKSYIIHGLCAYHKLNKRRVLIIIDRNQLVLQLKNNFTDEFKCEHVYKPATIYDTQEEIEDADVVITTWQSIVKNPRSFYDGFEVIIGDEVHGHKAKSLITIMDNCGRIAWRHGFTATLDNDSKTDRLTLIGMYGPVTKVATTKELIDQGIIARPTIVATILRWSPEKRRELQKLKVEATKEGATPATLFQIESTFIENDEVRNNLIRKMAKNLTGNTLIAFKNRSHGKTILELINGDKEHTFFVNGTIDKKKRVKIAETIDTLKDSTSVVSFGTFSTGISIKRINNMIIASQLQSAITVPQLIGRTLRKTEGKTKSLIIDLGDDLSIGKSENIFMKHFKTRLEIYTKQGFHVVIKYIDI